MTRLATAYLPHAFYGLAIISISIHLISKRKSFEDEKTSLNARITLLESIADKLRTGDNKPADVGELERLKRLAMAPVEPASQGREGGISWKEVIFNQGRSLPVELSHWEKRDLEKVQQETNGP